MNLADFYDNIVLRDLGEYTAPGAIAISGLCLLNEAISARLGLGTSLSEIIMEHPWHFLFLFLFMSYVLGHVLTGIHTLVGRKEERKLASTVLNKRRWLKERVVEVVSRQFDIPSGEAAKLLDCTETAEVIREIGRSIIDTQCPELFREYVGRHSIISRFCQNLVIAIGIFTISLALCVWIQWDVTYAKVAGSLGAVVPTGFFLFLLVWITTLALNRRSKRLRETMARHTFEIWIAASLRLTSKEAASDTKAPHG